jgi:DNA-binding NtrC family response regulator
MALILVVDDEQDACTMLHRILSVVGHEVVAFTHAHKALFWLQSNIPDLVILDFKLQGLDGIQLLKLIRELNPEIKTVILTAYPSVEIATEALKLGAMKYLIKPIEIDHLEANVAEVLSSMS